MSDIFALFTSPADCIVSILRRTLAIDFCSRHQDHARGGFREGQWNANALRRTLHTARRPEIVRRCSRAVLGWLLSVAAVVPACPVIATCILEPPSPRSLFTHACLLPCAAGQSALLVLYASTGNLCSCFFNLRGLFSLCSYSFWRRSNYFQAVEGLQFLTWAELIFFDIQFSCIVKSV